MQTRRRFWGRAVGIAIAIMAQMSACSDEKMEPQDSSATHFLQACSGSCPGGLECVCGVCTKGCVGASGCQELSQGATCVAPSGPSGLECTAPLASVCDVECTTSAGCASLGVSFECLSGRCRSTGDGGTAPGPDAGDPRDGAAGSGGASSVDGATNAGGTNSGGSAGASADASVDSSATPSPESGTGLDASLPDAAPPGPVVFASRFDTLGVHAKALAVDRADGSTYVLTIPSQAIDLGSGPVGGTLLIKLTPAGVVDWYKVWTDVAGFTAGLAVDASGNVVITADYRDEIDLGAGRVGAGGQPSDYGVFVAKYARSGAYVFGRAWKGSGSTIGRSAVVRPDGRILIGGGARAIDFGQGTIDATPNQEVGFVALLEADGTVLWSRGAHNAVLNLLATDASGNAIVIGHGHGQADFGGPASPSRGGTEDFMIARLSPTGDQTELTLFGSSTTQEANVVGGVADSAGNVYLTGAIDSPFAFGSGPTLTAGAWFMASIAPGGAHRYSFSMQGEGSFARVGVDDAGRAWVTGNHIGGFAVGTQSVPAPAVRAGLLFRVPATGVADWLRSYGGSGADSTGEVALDGTGRPTVTGVFQESVDFSGGPMVTANSLVVARINP